MVIIEKQTGFVLLNGSEMYYEVAGTGPALVFLHGFSLDTRMWDAQFDVFAERYRVLRYDMRGFGKTSPPDAPYGSHTDLKSLLEYLQIETAHLCGLSLGGLVAINFALCFPAAVRSLVLVDTALQGWDFSEAYTTWTADIFSSVGIEAAKDKLLHSDLFAPALKHAEAGAQIRRIITDYSGWHFANVDPEPRLEPLAVDRIHTLGTPVLIIIGEYDLPDFQAIAEYIYRHVPGAHKVVMSGVGHMANMENAVVFNTLVMNFLTEVDDHADR